MYCSLGQNQFFDDAGAPLSAGRVKIYAKESDTLLPIYEDNGDGFVPAQNPVITANDGRIPTIFWPAALVDVVVEKSNGDGTYTELDSYVAGLDLSSVEAVQGVGSITELRSIMPSDNMVVQVNGYYTAGDSPTRKYLWVAGAANIEDGGYVISSYRDYNGGRWVMLWDDPEFMPVSLYGIMCGYSGYAKNSNIPALEGLGHYVLVGIVRVEVPPVILFDWRMAQPTSGQSSPVAYYWNGTFTTTHYVACARGVVFSTVGNPTIHCAGVRGDSYATAYWMVDQDYTSNDPAEKISTLMFKGNTSAMHDAFMACAACSKVRMVELSQDGSGTTLYDLLDSGDSFAYKIVIDYTSIMSVQYITGGCVWIQPYLGNVRISGLKAASINASSGTFSSDLLTDLLTVTTRASIGGDCTIAGNMTSIGKLIFSSGIRFKDDNNDCIENPNDASYYPHSPKFPHGLYVVGALNATTLSDNDRKMHIVVPGTGLEVVDLTTDSQVVSTTSFYNSKYKLNDIIIVSNTGNSTIIVKAASGYNVVIQGSLSCAFIKVDSARWNLISYVQ